MARRVLVVDDEELSRWSLAERLRGEGFEILEAASAEAALERADAAVELVLLADTLPDTDTVSLIEDLHTVDPDLAVMTLTADSGSDAMVRALRAGAFDSAAKPFAMDDVVLRVERALETARTRRDLRLVRDGFARAFDVDTIVGESEPMQRAKLLVRKIATSPGSTVLLTGEMGTGKALFAKVVHYASPRADRLFLRVRCAGQPEDRLASELFGHERGAFVNDDSRSRGVLERAHEGTVLLEEVGGLTPDLQGKLLRLLEDRALRRIGGSMDIPVDVRIVATTSGSLEDEIRNGRFREDLYYRLNVLRIEVPPLRSRGGDIVLLAQHFAETFGRELARGVRGLSPTAESSLKAYSWPGNVRELRNLVERAVLLSEGDTLEIRDFESLHTLHAPHGDRHGGFNLPPEGVLLDDVEKTLVVQALERAGGNQTRAAALLGLHRDQIRYRIEKFGLGKKSAG
jgi:DNA-binding NtrC family response regulator